MHPCQPSASLLEGCLFSPFASAIVLDRVPSVLLADRPLEIMLSRSIDRSETLAIDIADCISTHVRLHIVVETSNTWRLSISAAVSMRPSNEGWIARALVRPGLWSDAVSVTLVTITLAGRSMQCDGLPSTLRTCYNHTPGPAGSVYEAAKAGDAAALQAALDAGSSTEEADEVCGMSY